MDLVEISKMTEDQAREFLEKMRWPEGPACVHCGSMKISALKGESTRRGLYKCYDCLKQFTVTVGTVFEDSHIPLQKWIMAFHLMCSSKKGISALQLKRNLGIAYKSAWHMAHRIRFAMTQEPLASMLMKKRVEVDETYIGGKQRGGKRGRGSENKTPVVALVERGGKIKTRVVERVSGKELKTAIRESVNKGATIYTDEWPAYRGIGKDFKGGHKIVNHGKGQYVRGDAYTNTAESYFALLKRGVHGTFHHVSKQHLIRYCNEFSFRWDHRKIEDGERTVAALQGVEGKRLMYSEPIGVLTN